MVCFLDRPAELLNDIYHHALAHGRIYDLRDPINPNALASNQECLGLLFASRQIRNEALPIFWAENDFNITTTPETSAKQHPWQLFGRDVPTGFEHVVILDLSFYLNVPGAGPTPPWQAHEGNVRVGMQIHFGVCRVRMKRVYRPALMMDAMLIIERIKSALGRDLIVEVLD